MSETGTTDLLTISLAQMAPAWFKRERTLEKVCDFVSRAANDGSSLVAFGEALVPGYPFWPERTGGAVFNSPLQKEFHAEYLRQAVQIESGHLDAVCRLAAQRRIAVILGCIERPADRGGHSVYASLVYIDAAGEICSVHRKLMPTYEERLTWSPGDGHGLRVHRLGAFTVGALNCWENWMPLPRAALYALGEDLHVAIWPGSRRNTDDITRFIARESRSYVMSVSGLMNTRDFPADTLHLDRMVGDSDEQLTDGGSCIAAPDGEWVVEPVTLEETVISVQIDHRRVREERQNFDAAGHYSRPDVTRLLVDRRRQTTVSFQESGLTGQGTGIDTAE